VPSDRIPLTEQQWRLLRQRMEAIAEGNVTAQVRLNPVELAGFVLLLMDRIDDLGKRIA
jgi:hypothetical protein